MTATSLQARILGHHSGNHSAPPSHSMPAMLDLPDVGGSHPAPTPPRPEVSTRRSDTSAVLDLLASSRRAVEAARQSRSECVRFASAHLAALRASAAVLAARATPSSRRVRGSRNAWVLLAHVAPEYDEWAAYFAAGAAKRIAAEAELPGAVTAREADDLTRDAEAFLDLVCSDLGIPPPPPRLPLGSTFEHVDETGHASRG